MTDIAIISLICVSVVLAIVCGAMVIVKLNRGR